MMIFQSPAVNLDPISIPGIAETAPLFAEEAAFIASQLREYSPWELESLLGINPKLALDAFENYQRFESGAKEGLALASFRGLAFQSMNPRDFTGPDYAFVADRLRLLSALYGILAPTDKIQPYRLDFLCRFSRAFDGGQGLYRHWGDRVCRELFRRDNLAINLSSGEYAKMILPHLLPGNRVITCRFLCRRRGKLTCLATASKMCRGAMVRYIVKNRIESPERLWDFEFDDFHYSRDHSASDMFVYIQD